MIAIPVAIKYFFAFEIRALLETLRVGEREVEVLNARFIALQRERDVVRGAMRQVVEQRKWAEARRGMMQAELAALTRIHQATTRSERDFEATAWVDSSLALAEQADPNGQRK